MQSFSKKVSCYLGRKTIIFNTTVMGTSILKLFLSQVDLIGILLSENIIGTRCHYGPNKVDNQE